MQRLEEKALATYPNPPPFWYRYVDDTITSLKKEEKADFLSHLNHQNPSMQFTIEPEKNGKLAFLDCLVTRSGNSIRTSVYRKPTSTDRLLDDSSYHPTSHKSATIKTLVKRAHVISSSNEDLEAELKHLNEVFDVNNYSKPFVNSVTEQANRTTTEASTTNEDDKVIATIPYVKGTSERIARILRPHMLVGHRCRLQTFNDSTGCSHKDKRSFTYYITNRNCLKISGALQAMSEKLGELWNAELNNTSAA